MLQTELDKLTISDLEELIERRVPEDRRLEFKRDLYDGSDRQKKEAAADISAMANGAGGTLILGIAEENGYASELVGVDSSNPDGLLLSIQDSLRSSIEPVLQGVQVKWVPIDGQRGAVVVQVPRSWYGPHRVIVGKDRNFYMRNENGKHPMSVEELRRAFAAGPEVSAAIEKFRTERIALLEQDEGSLAIQEGFPKLVVHVVPYIAFREPVTFDLRDSLLPPIGASGWNDFASVEGKVSYSGPEEDFTSVRAFSTLFRDGRVEAVAKIYTGEKDGKTHFSLAGVESDIISTFWGAKRKFDDLGIPPPYAVMISFLDVKGCHGAGERQLWSITYPCRRNRLLLPAYEVTESDLDCDAPDTMFALATLLWNAFGHKVSPNFDHEGRHRPPSGC